MFCFFFTLQIMELFDEHQGETFEVTTPNATERLSFFQQIFTKKNSKADNNISNKSSYGLSYLFIYQFF